MDIQILRLKIIENTGDFSTEKFVTKADGQLYAEKLWSIKRGGEVVIIPILESYSTNGSVNGSMIAISKNSKNPEKAMEFLNILNTDRYLRNLINYGIEGVHYEKISNNKIRLLEESKNYMVDYYTLGNLFIKYLLEDEPENKWERFKEINNISNVSQALGFKFDSSKVSVEFDSLYAVFEEFTRSLYTGLVDTEEYVSKLINKLESVGIDKVKEELERQLNDWKIKKQTS
ncbi:ABC transporter substrate-binding protein [Clostridium sp.]|uniref:ABC transporter substrate-binding protein n=1 Tax=Clostridium sp. TaxID=1506 RepID=UPI00262B42F4